MGVELWFVHPSYPVDFEMNQDFISSFYEQAKMWFTKISKPKQKQFAHSIFSVTPVSCSHPHITAFQTVLI